MRQVGVLAAACLVAIETMVDRLADDHVNAKRLASGIAELRPDAVDVDEVETNIILVRTQPLGFQPAELVSAMGDRGVKFLVYRPGVVRMLTHKDVSDEDVSYVLERLAEIIK